MLLEGAIRFGRQAEAAMRRGECLAASVPLMRVVDIMGELLAGVRASKTELNQKIAEFYVFLFRTLAEAKVNEDVAKLSEALDLLEYERQTWQLVCDKLGTATPGVAAPHASSAAEHRPRKPMAPPLNASASPATSSFSFEA
jgi:flagellar protein FliS